MSKRSSESDDSTLPEKFSKMDMDDEEFEEEKTRRNQQKKEKVRELKPKASKNFMAQKAALAKISDAPVPHGSNRIPGMRKWMVHKRQMNLWTIIERYPQPPKERPTIPTIRYDLRLKYNPNPTLAQPLISEDMRKFDLNNYTSVWVDNKNAFETMVEYLQKQREIYVDLEGNNTNCYLNHTIALIQITTRGNNYLIDPLTTCFLIRDELKKVFENPNVCKIFHDFTNDVKNLLIEYQIQTVSIVDSSVLYHVVNNDGNVAGHQLISCGNFVTEMLGPQNPETIEEYKKYKDSYTAANWLGRPLKKEFITYAVADTWLLMKAVNELKLQFSDTQENMAKMKRFWVTCMEYCAGKLMRKPFIYTYPDMRNVDERFRTLKFQMASASREFKSRNVSFNPRISYDEKDLKDLLRYILYLAVVMDDKEKYILDIKDLAKILILRPATEEEMLRILSQHARRYPTHKYWSKILIRFLHDGPVVFHEMAATKCNNECGERGHTANMCPKYLQPGKLFYRNEPEYMRVKINAGKKRHRHNKSVKKSLETIKKAMNDVKGLLDTEKLQNDHQTVLDNIDFCLENYEYIYSPVHKEEIKKVTLPDTLESIQQFIINFGNLGQSIRDITTAVGNIGQLIMDEDKKSRIRPCKVEEEEKRRTCISACIHQLDNIKANPLNDESLSHETKFRQLMETLYFLSNMVSDEDGNQLLQSAINKKLRQVSECLPQTINKVVQVYKTEKFEEFAQVVSKLEQLYDRVPAFVGVIRAYCIKPKKDGQKNKDGEENAEEEIMEESDDELEYTDYEQHCNVVEGGTKIYNTEIRRILNHWNMKVTSKNNNYLHLYNEIIASINISASDLHSLQKLIGSVGFRQQLILDYTTTLNEINSKLDRLETLLVVATDDMEDTTAEEKLRKQTMTELIQHVQFLRAEYSKQKTCTSKEQVAELFPSTDDVDRAVLQARKIVKLSQVVDEIDALLNQLPPVKEEEEEASVQRLIDDQDYYTSCLRVVGRLIMRGNYKPMSVSSAKFYLSQETLEEFRENLQQQQQRKVIDPSVLSEMEKFEQGLKKFIYYKNVLKGEDISNY